MKKVLLVFPGLRTRENEGSKHRLECFIDAYAQNGYSVTTLAYVKDWPWGRNVSLNRNCKWIYLPFILPSALSELTTRLLNLYIKVTLAIITRLGRYNVVQMEITGFKSRICSKKSKYIVDFHSDVYHEEIETGETTKDSWYSNLNLKSQKDSIKSSDHIICVSERLKEQLERNTGEKIEHYSIISCGVSLHRFLNSNSNQLLKDLNIEDKLIFGYCGGLHKWQNVGKILDIFNRIKRLEPKSYFMVFTNGDISEYKDELDKLGSDKCCVKALSPDDIPDYLGMLDGGFLIRDNLILNIVSSPTKISEYIAAGAALICTPYAGDYKALTEGHNNCFELKDFSDNTLSELVEWLWRFKELKPYDVSYLNDFTFDSQFKKSGVMLL